MEDGGGSILGGKPRVQLEVLELPLGAGWSAALDRCLDGNDCRRAGALTMTTEPPLHEFVYKKS